MINRILVILISLAIAAIRVGGHTGEIFQAVAHLWVGGVFVGGVCKRDRATITVAVALSLVELACFLAGVGK